MQVKQTYDKWIATGRSNIDFCVGCSELEYQILNAICALPNIHTVLEIGPGQGASTEMMLISLFKNNAKLTQVEFNPEIKTTQLISSEYLPNVQTIYSTSLRFFETNTQRFDLIFVDGDHSAVGSEMDIKSACASLNPNGLILAHDIYSMADWIEGYCIKYAKDNGKQFAKCPKGGMGLGVIF